MKLVKPSYINRGIPANLSVEEHYLEEEKLKAECKKKAEREKKKTGRIVGWCTVLYHYECTACGHKDLGMNERKYGL